MTLDADKDIPQLNSGAQYMEDEGGDFSSMLPPVSY